jgi:aminocarboxymuconate-semialdehyde decarboxylase
MASASAGACLLGGDLIGATPRASQGATATPKRRRVSIGGRQVKTVDMHCHCTVPEIADVIKGTKLESRIAGLQAGGGAGFDNSVGATRLQKMDEEGIDVQAMSINSFWYGVDRDLAQRLMEVQNQKLAQVCKTYPGRLVAFAAVALQFPDLAAQQLEDGVKHLGLCGAAIGPSVEGG